jgi:hypothetical protein
MREAQQIIKNNPIRISKWEMIEFKLKIKQESQRQFFWYQFNCLMFVLHMLAHDFDITKIDPNVPDYEIRRRR